MNLSYSVRQVFSQMPVAARRFLIRAGVLFAVWKALYLLILLPAEIPDAWLVKKLGSTTAFVLNKVLNTSEFYVVNERRQRKYGDDVVNVTYSTVQSAGKKLIGIYQACNGLELMILYTGFIVAFTGSLKRKLLYITGGLLSLYLVNILRLVLLGYISITYPHHFQFAHKYLFNLVVYVCTFLLWIGYVSPKTSADKSKGI